MGISGAFSFLICGFRTTTCAGVRSAAERVRGVISRIPLSYVNCQHLGSLYSYPLSQIFRQSCGKKLLSKLSCSSILYCVLLMLFYLPADSIILRIKKEKRSAKYLLATAFPHHKSTRSAVTTMNHPPPQRLESIKHKRGGIRTIKGGGTRPSSTSQRCFHPLQFNSALHRKERILWGMSPTTSTHMREEGERQPAAAAAAAAAAAGEAPSKQGQATCARNNLPFLVRTQLIQQHCLRCTIFRSIEVTSINSHYT